MRTTEADRPANDRRVGEIFETVKQWGRWGPEDERGALNLITATEVQAAAALIRDGQVISCGRDLPTHPSPENAVPAQHMMLMAGDCADATGVPGFEQTTDYLGIACHGLGISHIDALCHIAVDHRMYNGFDIGEVKSIGAMRNSIAAASAGIVGRGVLLDVARACGKQWLDPPGVIEPDDLDAAVTGQGTVVRPGDIVLISTGRDARREALGEWPPYSPGLVGLDAECIPWLHEREIAVLGSDAISDPLPPQPTEKWPFPVHQCCIAGMGVHLLDNLRLDHLADACQRAGRWEFQFSVHPLRAARATGCAVNPIAIL